MIAARHRYLIFAAMVLLTSTTAHAATTYYVDAETGVDSNTGIAPELAWKTIAKVNGSQSLLRPGDSVLFRAGQSFSGPLKLATSGTIDLPITYGRYGDGAKPEITGFALPTDWKLIEKGIWEAVIPGAPSTLNLVTIDEKTVHMGRFPNSDAPNGGYLTVDSHVGNTSITDAELPPTPNWTGAEVVIRKYRWIIDRSRITSHAGQTLTCTPASTYHAVDQHGYFIQNDPRTLDAYGEWYFDPGKKTLRVFTGAAEPAKASIKASAVDTLVQASGRQDICFAGLRFTGANHVALSVDGSTRISIRDCLVRWSGIFAIQGSNVKNFTLEDSTIEDTQSNAVGFHNGVSNSVIRRVTINNTGVAAGMGLSNDGTYNAITMMGGNDNLIESFTITNTGYIPVHFSGSRITVRDGFIDQYATVKDDSGGIYTWTGAADRTVYTDRKIIGNIILNSKGAIAGAVGEAKGFGIYLDDACSNVEVRGNTVAHTSAGIFLHNAHHIQITGNTFFDNGVQMLFAHDDIDPAAKAEIREVVSTNNILISKTRLQQVISASSKTDDYAQFGKFERNIYARPADQNLIIDQTVKDAILQAYDIEGWRAVYGLDSGTQPSSIKVAPYKIINLGPNLVLNGAFTKDVKESSCWTQPGNSLVSFSEGKLDGGALQHAYKNPSGKTNPSIVMVNAGKVTAGKQYLLRFSILGTVNHGSAKVRLRQGVKPWGGITDYQPIKHDSTRRECELLFDVPTNQPASSIEWAFNERHGNFWLDNVTLQEATIAEIDPQIFRFEYNSTNQPRTLELQGEWLDILGKAHRNQFILPPRESIVLIRKDACLDK